MPSGSERGGQGEAAPASALSAVPADEAFFEVDFQEGIPPQFTTWGDPPPAYDQGNVVVCKGLHLQTDDLSAGVSTRPEFKIYNAPLVMILFETQPFDADHPITFDWDPHPFVRGPNQRGPGAVRVEVWTDRVKMTVRDTRRECVCHLGNVHGPTCVCGVAFSDNHGIDLYVDSIPVRDGALSMGMGLTAGSFSFSGQGYLDRVRVMKYRV